MSKFMIIVREEIDSETTVERYSQTVDVLNLKAIIAAVNTAPRKPREPKVKVAA